MKICSLKCITTGSIMLTAILIACPALAQHDRRTGRWPMASYDDQAQQIRKQIPGAQSRNGEFKDGEWTVTWRGWFRGNRAIDLNETRTELNGSKTQIEVVCNRGVPFYYIENGTYVGKYITQRDHLHATSKDKIMFKLGLGSKGLFGLGSRESYLLVNGNPTKASASDISRAIKWTGQLENASRTWRGK